MGKELATVGRSDQFVSLRDLLDKNKASLQAALPKHMNADRLIRVALTAWQKTPELANCSARSVLGAVMEAAQLGLEPDGMLGHAYLIPYKGSAKLIPGYKGYIALGYRSGMVASFSAHVVYSNDHFDFSFGLDEKLDHKPCMDGDRGTPICVYAVCKLKDGAHSMVVLTKTEVEKFRHRSQAPNSPAWTKDWDAMACKTAVRQLAKWIPQCPELQTAAGAEEAIEVGALTVDDALDITDASNTSTSRADVLADKLGAGSKPTEEKQPEEVTPTGTAEEASAGDQLREKIRALLSASQFGEAAYNEVVGDSVLLEDVEDAHLPATLAKLKEKIAELGGTVKQTKAAEVIPPKKGAAKPPGLFGK